MTTTPNLSHDRAKNHVLNTKQKPYLYALGITNDKGEVIKSAQDKFRQINKYIEIVDGLIQQLPKELPLRIVDMGAGKGYLTFALYDYLAQQLKRDVKVTGVEYRVDLVTLCNDIAQNAGFTELTFVQGSIADVDMKQSNVVIALHACDTATDDAIAAAIKAKAALIVVAPCCHKQIRKLMQPLQANHPLSPLLKYGTYVERMAEMLTDSLRALVMQREGYRTKVFEFIGSEHTPKNVMIVGIKTSAILADEKSQHARAIDALKAEFGIDKHYLETQLD